MRLKRLFMVLAALAILAVPVRALEIEAPDAPDSVADAVEEEADSFAQGLWNVFKASVEVLDPSLADAARTALKAAAAVLLCSLIREMVPGGSGQTINLACTVAVAAALLEPASSLIQLGLDTVTELSEYGKLLLPVMTGALAAQGGVTASTAMYAATAFFDSILSAISAKLLIPLVYLYLGLAVANAAFHEQILGRLQAFLKWGMTWILKSSLYIFTGYLTVTGVVSGTTDAAAVKAAKLTISGAVPVVGGILSDASESVLSGIGVLRNGVGVYGLLTLIALFLTPFLKIGIQYLLLKGTSVLCDAFDGKGAAGLVADFSSAMGLVLGLVGTQTVMLLISTVCFMKGVG